MNESQVFTSALKLATPDERAAYLDEVCAGNPQLRADVEALLRAHASDPDFLEQPSGSLGATVATPADPGTPREMPAEPRALEQPGVMLAGRYKLLEQIGEGGMGTVWMAQQTEPVKRLVAVKLIKAGLGSKVVLARFEAERQAVALMDHPNIAKVLDAGAAPDGRPFFVMELVKGVPITRYCDEHRLTPRQRLELFVPVCQAVQHAHHKGIIHRDLKPSNVLVALYDDRPVPKVIDFGVAKATSEPLTEQTLHTGFGAVVGTVEYMSPEQASLNQLDVDARSDIYALGVLLYELLTGCPPFGRKELEKAGMLEMLRRIREQEPSKPSTKLSTAEGLPTLAANRGTEPKRLTALVRGELDWIVMKALEKDRNRRYETANNFATDVQRYLNDEPVQACPPTARYRLRKFIRRNKGPVLAAVLLMLTFVAGFIGTGWEMVRAIEAEATAVDEASQKQAALKESEAALAKARKSERARTEQLWEALVAEARATRLSRRGGQRFKSLEILQRATKLAHTLDLPAAKLREQRNAAVATLAMPDLYLTGPWVACPADVFACDFDENHTICACTDRQGVCSIRRVVDGVELYRLPGLGVPAHPYLSPDGNFIGLTHANKENNACLAVRLWQLDGRTPRLLRTEKEARWVRFHPNGKHVAWAYNDGAIGLFELPSGRQRGRLAPGTLTSEIRIALHPTEPLVAVCSYFGSVVQLRDVQTGKVLAALPSAGRATNLAWHPDGRTLAVGMAGSAIRLYDRTTLRLFRTLETDSTVDYLVFNHAGDRLAAVGWASSVQLFDVSTGQKLFATPTMPWSLLRFSRDDRRLAGAIMDGKLGTWQVGDSREHRTLVPKGLHHGLGLPGVPQGHGYTSAAVDPHGRLLALGTTGGFGLWDLGTGSELAWVSTGGRNHHLVAFEASGAVLVLGPKGLFRWPIPRDVVTVAGVIGPPERLPLPYGSVLGRSSDGRVIVTCSRTAGIEGANAGGWILHTDQPDRPIRLDPGADIGYITVSPDGKWVITCAHSGGVAKVWDARNGKLVKRLAERMGYPQFSPDGRWLSTCLNGGRLIAVGTWELGPKIAAGSGVFSPDSKLLAVSTSAGIHLIDHTTGREVALLEGPNLDSISPLTFTADGTKLIALHRLAGAHVWDLRLIRRHLKEMGLDWDWPEFRADARSTRAVPAAAPAVVRAVGAEPLVGRKVWHARASAYAQANAWDKAIACYQRMIDFDPGDPLSHNNLAWILATCAEPRFRNAAEAVKLARKAVVLGQKNGTLWNTLGVAHYRARDWKAALKALEKSLELQGDNSWDFFFLSMAHWQLGQKIEARTYYDKAIAWMGKKQPKNEELRRFRAEAEEVLKSERKKD